ncbi:MAG: hypothetical protein ACO2PN_18850 [Pyrobaculum sp.]
MEVVKGAEVPPAPGTDARWRAAVREAVYTFRHRGLRRRGGCGQLDSPGLLTARRVPSSSVRRIVFDFKPAVGLVGGLYSYHVWGWVEAAGVQSAGAVWSSLPTS